MTTINEQSGSIPGTVVETILVLLYELEKIELGETDGMATIAQAKDVFPGWINDDFKNYGIDTSSSGPTAVQSVSVYELRKDATLLQMFASLGKPLDELYLTQAQIVDFCKKYRDKLQPEGFATLVLLKENGEYFVALVDVCERKLLAFVRRFDSPDVWDADRRHRVVVPQLQ